LSAQHGYIPIPFSVEDGNCLAARPVLVWLDDLENEREGGCRVERISTPREHGHAGCSREVIRGAYCAMRTELRLGGRHAGSNPPKSQNSIESFEVKVCF
jgi:hypothetical protein